MDCNPKAEDVVTTLGCAVDKLANLRIEKPTQDVASLVGQGLKKTAQGLNRLFGRGGHNTGAAATPVDQMVDQDVKVAGQEFHFKSTKATKEKFEAIVKSLPEGTTVKLFPKEGKNEARAEISYHGQAVGQFSFDVPENSKKQPHKNQLSMEEFAKPESFGRVTGNVNGLKKSIAQDEKAAEDAKAIKPRTVSGVGDVNTDAAGAKAVENFATSLRDEKYSKANPSFKASEDGTSVEVSYADSTGAKKSDSFTLAELSNPNSDKVRTFKGSLEQTANEVAAAERRKTDQEAKNAAELRIQPRQVEGLTGNVNTDLAGTKAISGFVKEVGAFSSLSPIVVPIEGGNKLSVTYKDGKSGYKIEEFTPAELSVPNSEKVKALKDNLEQTAKEVAESNRIKTEDEAKKAADLKIELHGIDGVGKVLTTAAGAKAVGDYIAEFKGDKYKNAKPGFTVSADGTQIKVSFLGNPDGSRSEENLSVSAIVDPDKSVRDGKPVINALRSRIESASAKVVELQNEQAEAAKLEKISLFNKSVSVPHELVERFKTLENRVNIAGPRIVEAKFSQHEKGPMLAILDRSGKLKGNPSQTDGTLITGQFALSTLNRLEPVVADIFRANKLDQDGRPIKQDVHLKADFGKAGGLVDLVNPSKAVVEFVAGMIKQKNLGNVDYDSKGIIVKGSPATATTPEIPNSNIEFSVSRLSTKDADIYVASVLDKLESVKREQIAKLQPQSPTPSANFVAYDFGAAGKGALENPPAEVRQLVELLSEKLKKEQITFEKENIVIKGKPEVVRGGFKMAAVPERKVSFTIDMLQGDAALENAKELLKNIQ